MGKSSKEWLVPLTGVAFVAVLFAGFAIAGEPPEAKEGGQKIIDHYVDNKDSIQIGAALSAVAGALLVFFFSYVAKVLRAAQGEGGMLPVVAIVGAGIVATGATIDGTIMFALAEAADDIDPSAAQAIEAIWDNDFLPLALGVVVILWSVGISVIKYGALPKWIGWVMIVLGVVAVTPVGFVSAMGLALLILIISVMLSLRARGASGASTA
jgi:hypothetical protein